MDGLKGSHTVILTKERESKDQFLLETAKIARKVGLDCDKNVNRVGA